jgi:hypothetical protein
MIPVNIHYDAVFEIDGRYTYASVAAWSDSGEALVVDVASGGLVAAQSMPGFVRLVENRYRGYKARSGPAETKAMRHSPNGPEAGPEANGGRWSG